MNTGLGLMREALAAVLSFLMILCLILITPFCKDAVATLVRPVPKSVQRFLRDSESGWTLFSLFWGVCGGIGLCIKDRSTFGLHFRAGQTVHEYSDTSRDVLDFYHARNDRLFNAMGQPPVLVWIHGGAWAHGHRAQFRVMAMRLARVGFSVAVVGYTEVQYPRGGAADQSVQVGAALDWTVPHAKSLGGDPDRVFALAHSSGAHLLMLWLLHFAGQRKKPAAGPLAGCMFVAGVYDLEAHYQHETLREVGDFSTLNPACGGTAASRAALSPDGFLTRLLARSTFCECRACPFSGGPSPEQLRAQLECLPRQMCLVHGKNDRVVPPTQSIGLFDRLQHCLKQNKTEIICELHTVENCNHISELIRMMLGDKESVVTPLLEKMAAQPLVRRRSERLAKVQ